MVTGNQIHQWLQQPKLAINSLESIKQLEATFPYFPFAALLQHYTRNGNSIDYGLLEYFNFNPVIFSYWEEPLHWSNSKPKEKNKLNLHPENWDHQVEKLLEYEQHPVQKDYFTDVSTDFVFEEKVKVAEKTDQSLLVMMSFSEWLNFLQNKTIKELEEEEEKRALKALWQKQKMTEAIEEENDEIPAEVFEMAVNSISREGGIVSESMAIVYEKQGKYKDAIDIYKKLILNNPNKSTYFADKIENLQKEIE
ncbi:MAG TPA: tetratricopeptide repeat protein [Edaphocola sp.]|nr:tetratricopeptide repeat protein [Edaphocola sp.]